MMHNMFFLSLSFSLYFQRKKKLSTPIKLGTNYHGQILSIMHVSSDSRVNRIQNSSTTFPSPQGNEGFHSINLMKIDALLVIAGYMYILLSCLMIHNITLQKPLHSLQTGYQPINRLYGYCIYYSYIGKFMQVCGQICKVLPCKANSSH